MVSNKLYLGFWFQCEKCNQPQFLGFNKFFKIVDNKKINDVYCKKCESIFSKDKIIEMIENDLVGIGISYKCLVCETPNMKLCESQEKSLSTGDVVKLAPLKTTQCRKCATIFNIESVFDQKTNSYKNIISQKS